jgi:ketosteroid isomerase-like protein
MLKLATTVAALSLALAACSQTAAPPEAKAAAPATAAADTPQVVYDRHVANMKVGNLEGVMADYADDAVVVAPPGIAGAPGVFVGKDNVRKLFTVLTDEKKSPGVRVMEETSKMLGDDTLLMRWAQYRGTPQAVTGTDVYVVRNGKIAFQVVTPDATPTWP